MLQRKTGTKEHQSSKNLSFNSARLGEFASALAKHHCKRGILFGQSNGVPVMTTVRRLASTPSVTCSAVDDDPNPLAPALPVISERIPIADDWNPLNSKN